MATYVETIRNKLRALTGSSKPSEIPAGFLALAEDVDTKMASYWSGTLAGKPAAGQANRFYYATDDKSFWHDTGSVWERLAGSEAVTPESVHVGEGTPYFYGVQKLAVAKNTAYEPSNGVQVAACKGRPTVVYLICGSPSGAATVTVGGVLILESQGGGGGSAEVGFTFIVPVGATWQYNNAVEPTGGGDAWYQAL